MGKCAHPNTAILIQPWAGKQWESPFSVSKKVICFRFITSYIKNIEKVTYLGRKSYYKPKSQEQIADRKWLNKANHGREMTREPRKEAPKSNPMTPYFWANRAKDT
jgi:hypothetical protein